MQKIIGFLFLLSSYGFGAIGSLTIPHDIDSAAIPKVIYIDQNNDSIVNKVNEIKDTVNTYLPGGGVYSGTSLTSTGNLRLTVDSDNNGTGNCLAMTHNGATDTIAKFCDDLSTKAFGALSITGRTTLTDSLIGVSQRLSGNLAAVNGAFSGTLGTTGLHTADGGILFATSNSGAQGKITKNSTTGLEIRGVAGSVNDVTISSADAGTIFANLTGTRNITVGHSSGTTTMPGPVTHSSTLTQTGLQSNSEAIAFVGNGTAGDGRIYRSSGAGLSLRGVTGSSYDFALFSASAGSYIMRVPTGTTTAEFVGPVTNSSTLTQTGVATFTAAPVFSSVTASQFLLVDGSKALTSVAGTGSGSVVRATSPTLVTPALGAATATSIVASGNITADSIISSKLHNFGTFTGTMTGMTTSPTTTARWERVGQNVTICLDSASGTSNATTFTVTGMPASLYPARNSYAGIAPFRNPAGSGRIMAAVTVQADGVIRFDPVEETSLHITWGTGSWSGAASTKGIGGTNGAVVIASVCFAYNRR